MPITLDNVKRAEDALARAKMNPNESAEKIAKLEANISEFYASQQSPGPGPQTQNGRTGNSLGGFYYEPSIDQFRKDILNPEIQKELGFTRTGATTSVAGDYLANKVPELRGVTDTAALTPDVVQQLDQNSEEFKRYKEFRWQQAQKADPSLQRYEDMEFGSNPFETAKAAALSVAAPVASAVAKTATMGLAKPLIKGLAADPNLARVGQPGYIPTTLPTATPEQAQANRDSAEHLFDTAENIRPGVHSAAKVAAYMLPGNPVNVGSDAAIKALGGPTRSWLARRASDSLVGGVGAAVEGTIQDIADNPDASSSDVARSAASYLVPGLALGAIGGQVAEASGGLRKTMRSGERGRAMRLHEDAGGDFGVFAGAIPSPNVAENIRVANIPGQHQYAVDVAARRVAPQIQESLETQARNQYKKTAEETNEYITSEVGKQKKSMKPVLDEVLAMFRRGAFESPVSGNLNHPNRNALNTFRDIVNRVGEVAYVPANEAALFAKKNDGILLENNHLNALGVSSKEGMVPVIIPSKMDAGNVLEFEQMIDDQLKMEGTPGGVNNPIWKGINRRVKSVRDQFGNEVDRVVTPTSPFSPASEAPAPTVEARPQVPVGINNPTPPEALQGIGNQRKFGADLAHPVGADAIHPNRPVVVGENPPAEIPVNNQNPPFNEKFPRGFQPPAERIRSEISEMSSRPVEPTEPVVQQNPQPVQITRERTAGQVARYPSPEEIASGKIPDVKYGQDGVAGATAHGDAQLDDVLWDERMNMQSLDNERALRLQEEFGYAIPENPQTASTPPYADPNYINQTDYDRIVAGRRAEDEARRRQYREQHINTPQGRAEGETGVDDLGGSSVVDLTPADEYHSVLPSEQYESITPSEIPSLPPRPASEAVVDQGSLTPGEIIEAMSPEVFPELEAARAGGRIQRQPSQQPQGNPDAPRSLFPNVPDHNQSIGKRSAEAAYSQPVENQGTFDRSQAKQQVIEGGGAAAAGKLNKGMRDASLEQEMSRYKGLTPEQATKEATNLDYPIDISLDGDNMMLRDGRHRLEAAKRAGATHIKARIRKYRPDGKAEEVAVTNIPISSASEAPPPKPSGRPRAPKESEERQSPVRFNFEATLEDGTKVTGLSALKRQQHLAQKGIDEATTDTGSNSKKTVHRRVMNYAGAPGQVYEDAALLEEAKNLGLDQQLREVAGTREYPNLTAPMIMSHRGPVMGSAEFLSLRADPVLAAIAGAERNPFAPLPQTIRDRVRLAMYDILRQQGGIGAARFGNEAEPFLPEDYRINKNDY